MLAFALAATVATTLLFGLIPAWQSAQLGPLPALNRANPRADHARVQFGRTLVVAQFALSLVLVAGAAALRPHARSTSARVETGFDRDHVLVVRMDPQGTGYEASGCARSSGRCSRRWRALPGVRARASLATASPFNGNVDGRRLSVPGVEPRDPTTASSRSTSSARGYFEALRMPILAGRPIDARDQADAAARGRGQRRLRPPLFRRHRQRRSAAGSTGRGRGADHARDRRRRRRRALPESAGAVRAPGLPAVVPGHRSPLVAIRVPGANQRQPGGAGSTRSGGDPAAPPRRADSRDPHDGRRRSTAGCSASALLAALGSFFAIVALTLAAVGVYGLLAHLVARRVPEIGVRLALGARPAEMMWATLRDNAVMAAIGCAIGLTAAFIGLRVLDGMLFGLAPTDVVTLGSAALILLLVSLAAAFLPARRAASVDPLVALRYE